MPPSATPQQNMTSVPLPPGLTLYQYQDHQGKVVTVAIAVACAAALACWDFFNLLPAELSLYLTMDRNGWKSLGTWAFVVLRYSGVFSLISGLWFTSLQSQYCQAAASLGGAGVVLVTGSAGIIFCYRVFSIWDFKTAVIVPVGILYLSMVGCWFAVVTQLHATEGPHTYVGSNCILGLVPVWSPIGVGSSVVFDTAILLLTVSKLWGKHMTRVSRQLLYDNIFYFVIVSIANLVVLVIQSLGNKFEYLKPLALPYPTLMATAVGSRVFLNLRLYDQRRRETSQGIPMASFKRTQGGSRICQLMKDIVVLKDTYSHTPHDTALNSQEFQSTMPNHVV